MAERPLIVTADETLLDELLRVAAAADVEVAHLPEPGSRAAWRQASLILIDAAAVGAAAEAGLPRREGVVAVAVDGGSVPWDQCIRLGVDRTLVVGESDAELIALLTDAVDEGGHDGQVLAVVGACGGAGASVLAAAVSAVADRTGQRVLLADCDPWGAGLDLLLGVEQIGGVHWGTLAAPSGRLSSVALHQALPRLSIGSGNISVLCHSRDGAAPATADEVTADIADVVISSGRRAGDLVVVDVARWLGAAGERVVEQADLVVLVATADVRGCFGGARVAARLAQLGVVPDLVVRGPSPGGIGADDVASALGLPLLARMRPQPFLARDLEAGKLPGADRTGPLSEAAGRVLQRLEQRR